MKDSYEAFGGDFYGVKPHCVFETESAAKDWINRQDDGLVYTKPVETPRGTYKVEVVK